MITDTGIVKLIDFSIAKEVGMVQHLPDLDITGSICGTASYFSPEQAYGYGVSFPSDVFSLGLVLFELISGRSPYSFGATPTAYHTASVTPESGSMVLGPAHEIEPIKRANCIIQETPARLRELMPNADPRLSDLLATMLSFKPVDRPSLAEISAFFAGLASP